MQDEAKTKHQLIIELQELRDQVAELEKNRAEEALCESDARLRQIIDLVPHMIFVKDWDGKYLLVNKALAQAYNTSVSDLTGKYHADFHPDESELQKMSQDDREVITKGETKFIPEEPFTNAQGNQCFVQAIKVPFHILGAKTPAMLGVAIDITDKKRAEEELRASEAKYRLISENTGDMIWQFDLDTGKFVYVSPSVHRLFGFTPEEFVGQNMEAVITPASMQYVSKRLPEIMTVLNAGDESVRVTTHELDQLRKDGSVVPIEAVITLLQDAAGRVNQLIGVTRDITEQRHAAEMLRESETKFRTLFDAMMEGVALHEIVYDEQGVAADYRIVSTNPAFEKHTGLKSEQVLGQLGSKVFGMDKAPHLARFARVATSGQPDSFESYSPSMNRYFDISVTSPKRGCFVIVFENITERKQAEDALKDSRQQLANIIEFLPDATFVINNEGKVIAWNKAIEEMTGVKAPDMLGKGNYEYALPFYGERRPLLIDLVIEPQEELLSKYASIERRATQILGEGYVYGLKAGKTYIYGTASVLRDSIGNIVGTIESIRDITERKKAEEELSAQTRRLEEFNAALKVLLKQREEDKTELQESVLLSVKNLIVPYVEKLKKSRLGGDQMTYLTIIESHVREIISPFTKRLSGKYLGLTPVEIQVASLIKDGKTTKEIAGSLSVSADTVSAHRLHIRKKLGLSKQKANLTSFLKSLEN